MLGWEHAFGQETMGAFQKSFEDAGGKVIQRIYAPLTTLDFGPYIGNLNKGADGLFEVATGSPSMSFLRSLKASGLMDKWKILTVGTAMDESFLQELKDMALGVISVDIYSAALDTPENKMFREKVIKATKRDPTLNTVCAYMGFDWIIQAIKAIGGDVENREKLMSAIRAVELKKSPRGAAQAGRLWTRHRERVRPPGGEGGRPLSEHSDPHVSDGLPVLEIQSGRVSQETRLQP